MGPHFGVMDTPDLHATILHLLCLEHEAFTDNYAGRDFRLTTVSGKVSMEIIAQLVLHNLADTGFCVSGPESANVRAVLKSYTAMRFWE